MVLDDALEERILAILRRNRARWRSYSEEAMRAGNRKQAIVPEGAAILEPIGTAPGLLVAAGDGAGPLVVVLPGPPGELRPMWETAAGTEPLRALLAGAGTFEQRMLRLYGVPESEIALSLPAIEDDGLPLERLEITTCLRRGEIEIATVFAPEAEPDYDAFAAGIAARHGDTLFSADGSTIDEQVAALLTGRTIAVAESCTGGLMAARLTDRAGSSAYVLGGVVVYSNAAKTALAGVPEALIEHHGAVSPEVAAALADGAIARFGAGLGIGITGIAGPGGGSPDKPVGTVCVSVAAAAGSGGPHRAAAGGPRHGPRADDDRRAAPAAAAARAAVSLRLFVALDLPAPARAALVAFRDAAADPAVWRPVPDASLHVTLAFLGHRPEEHVGAVAAVLQGLEDRPAPPVALGDSAPASAAPCAGADRRAHRCGRGAGAPAGGRGRRAGGRRAARARDAPLPPARDGGAAALGSWSPRTVDAVPEPVACAAGPVVLYRSHLGRGGAVYEPLAVRALG